MWPQLRLDEAAAASWQSFLPWLQLILLEELLFQDFLVDVPVVVETGH